MINLVRSIKIINKIQCKKLNNFKHKFNNNLTKLKIIIKF